MSHRPSCRIVDSLPAVGTDIRLVRLSELPDQPFDLSALHLTAVGHVHDVETERFALLGAARGADLIIRVTLERERLATFLDELDRVSDVVSETHAPSSLTPEQLALLDALAAGMSLAEACRQFGLSRRTATRRLADARARLGVASTTEALTRRAENGENHSAPW